MIRYRPKANYLEAWYVKPFLIFFDSTTPTLLTWREEITSFHGTHTESTEDDLQRLVRVIFRADRIAQWEPE